MASDESVEVTEAHNTGGGKVISIHGGPKCENVTISVPLNSVADTRDFLLTLEAAIALSLTVVSKTGQYTEAEVLRGIRQVLSAPSLHR